MTGLQVIADYIFELEQPMKSDFILLLRSVELTERKRHHSHVPDDHSPHFEIELLVIQKRQEIDMLRELMLCKIVSNILIFNQIIDEPDNFFQ